MGKLGFLVLQALTVIFVSGVAFAAPEAAEAASSGGWSGIGAGLAIGLAVIGGATGIGRANASTLESIARNPGASSSMQAAWFLGLVFIEAMVILSFVVALKLA